ncbi:hypothetical protein GCM10023321_37780 [Pseudonocardia eucalypti]|uniref:Antirestriction protein ArdA n=1 Tax=Pseudonocardia eucalypti TaxID=648755 RepID=A0ABP9Q853_9PSEU|nr:antirestriction protein [Pseudonocardia eucalypti]
MEHHPTDDTAEAWHWHDNTPPETAEPASSPERSLDAPRIYLRDNGAAAKRVERGQWLDATADPKVLEAAKHELLDMSPFRGATVSIRQHSCFEGLDIDEWEDLATVSRLARGVAAHGRAFVAYVEAWGRSPEAVAAFGAHYVGSWPDVATWAQAVAEDRGWWDQLNEHVDEQLLPHLRIDYEGLGRELTYDAHVVEDDERSQIHVFRLHA